MLAILMRNKIDLKEKKSRKRKTSYQNWKRYPRSRRDLKEAKSCIVTYVRGMDKNIPEDLAAIITAGNFQIEDYSGGYFVQIFLQAEQQ